MAQNTTSVGQTGWRILTMAAALVGTACAGSDFTEVGDMGHGEDEAIEHGATSLLTTGDSGPEVVKAHAYFRQFGYFENEALRARFPLWRPVVGQMPVDDSIFGEELVRAVSAYQARSALPVTGEIDEATRAMMNAPRCGVPDSSELDARDKFLQKFDWQTDRSLDYELSLDPAQDDYGDLSLSQVEAAIDSAFTRWSLKTDVTFRRVTSNRQVLMGFIDNTGGDSIGVATPTSIFFRNGVDWQATGVGGGVHFESVAMHEIGHMLGLGHSSVVEGNAKPVMYASIDADTVNQALRPDDLQAIAVSGYTHWILASSVNNGAVDIGSSTATAGATESTWKLGNGTNSEGFKTWRWNGSGWIQITGGGVRIDVAGRVPWVVTDDGLAKEKAGVTAQSPNGQGWTNRGDCDFKDIGANRNNTIWAVGGATPDVNGDYDIYRFKGGTGTSTECSTSLWEKVDGKARYIDVAPNDSPWIVRANGVIRHRNGVTFSNKSGTAWATYEGSATDVAVGPDAWGPHSRWHIDASNRIFFTSFQSGIDDNGDGDTDDAGDTEPSNHWIRTANGGLATAITVGADGLPWVVGTDGLAYRRAPR